MSPFLRGIWLCLLLTALAASWLIISGSIWPRKTDGGTGALRTDLEVVDQRGDRVIYGKKYEGSPMSVTETAEDKDGDGLCDFWSVSQHPASDTRSGCICRNEGGNTPMTHVVVYAECGSVRGIYAAQDTDRDRVPDLQAVTLSSLNADEVHSYKDLDLDGVFDVHSLHRRVDKGDAWESRDTPHVSCERETEQEILFEDRWVPCQLAPGLREGELLASAEATQSHVVFDAGKWRRR